MRSVFEAASVRLYHVDPSSGVVTTLLYGSLTEALIEAAKASDDIQPDLFIQTDNDVCGYLDLQES